MSDPNIPEVLCISPPCDTDGIKYLVESEGELLQIVRRTNSAHRTDCFTVFKLDFKSVKWVKLKNLSGQVLFVGDNSSLSLPISDLPGCKPNWIYFSGHKSMDFHERKCPRDMGIFSMEDGILEPHFGHKSGIYFLMLPIWIVPSL